ncbi:MAG: hypothetical protein K2I28_01405 [Muribaculaceae bacterium]|nr:hypothetical protein [Muribaculaceae bacterium]
MTKFHLKTLGRGLAGVMLGASLLVPAAASADVLFSETFPYAAGTLVPQGGWIQNSHKENPIQVTQSTLSYDGFLTGNSVKLKASSATDQDVAHACVSIDSDGLVSPITTGDVYVATLVNVQNVEATKYFFSCVSTNYSNKLADGSTFTGDYNRVFAVPSETAGKFKLGFGKSTTTPTETSSDLDLNTTYLVVLHIGINEGPNNDVFEAWINPSSTKTDAMFAPTTGSDMSKGFVGVAIHQTTNFSGNCPEMLVGPIKVATTWEELFGNEGGQPVDPVDPVDPADKGEITFTTNMPSEWSLYQYQSFPVTVNVKATDLTDNITVGGFSSAVKASATTIPAADAMSADGYDLTLTLCSTSGDAISESVTLTSGKAQATVAISVPVMPAKQLMNFRFASSTNPWDVYYFSGNARVTYVDEANQRIYMQDPVGGLCVGYEYLYMDNAPYKVGDKITKLFLMAEDPSFGVPMFQLSAYYEPNGGVGYGTLVAENDFQTPAEVSLADLKSDPDSYINRLVKVSDLTFENAGSELTATGTAVTSGEAAGRVRPFAGTDAIGTVIPETATVTGISTSMSAAIITVRSASDIEVPSEPAGIELEKTLLIEPDKYYPVGVDTPFATIKVKATAMTAPTAVWIGGKQRGSFSTDIDEIPAGTGEYTVNITFNPTVTGRNEAMINFDASPTELSQSVSFAALAYDPDNMPEFTVDASAIEPFSAAVGSTMEQTLTINAKNLLDYGNVRVLGTSGGAFRISSTSFLKAGQSTLKVTFAPTAEGTFNETIEFSTPMAETVTVQVSGSTSGAGTPEDKEGDELIFDTSSPLASYATDFNGSGDKNKPLSLAPWKNVALDGTRAFWSYTVDGNTMAKVTAYDSKVAESSESPAEMLLLSPALDFVNSPSRLLEFSIMGEYLTDDMTDQFSVLYIDPTLPENERYQVIGGIDIPQTADASGEWRPFILDLDGLDIADTFFIGFHYLSTRGRNTTAVYYVDDFSWGSTTTPFIRVDKPVATATTQVGSTVTVDEFTVTGMNLTEDVTIAFEGAHKDLFGLSTSTLPAEGGKFTVSYSPVEEGQHAVYVTLSSAGAPVTYLTVGGTATPQSGIGAIEAGRDGASHYYDLQGRRITRPVKGNVYIRVDADGKTAKITL